MKKDATSRWLKLGGIVIAAVIAAGMWTVGKLGWTAIKVSVFGSDETKKKAEAASKELEAAVEADRKAAANK